MKTSLVQPQAARIKRTVIAKFIRILILVGMLFSLFSIMKINRDSDSVFAQTLNPQETSTPNTGSPEPPLNLIFPEPVDKPVSDWRPPLYQVPFALGPHDHFLFTRPIAVDTVNWPQADYRYGYLFPGGTNMHTGIDIVSPLHTPVIAAAGGKVVFAGFGLLNGVGDKDDPYGLAVVIRHSFGFDGYTLYTVYAHMEKSLVSSGEWVSSGDTIGQIGMTGMTTGPHLHFEIRLQDGEDYTIRNPELWLVPPIGYGVLAGRIENDFGTLLPERDVWIKSLENGKQWKVITYTVRMKDNDDYYLENFVIGDLPAGQYEISTYFNYKFRTGTIQIVPGAVNYVEMNGSRGFIQTSPQTPSISDFIH